MYFIQNLFIWIRKFIIRTLLREYPNRLLNSSTISTNSKKNNTNLISSTDNFWVSQSMHKRWQLYDESNQIDLSIYSNKQVNEFMKLNFKNDLIYEIYQKSILPVQKIDLFRICFIYLHGGIWLDLKSEVNIGKIFDLYNKSKSNGILLVEPREIEVITSLGDKQINSKKKVIHNGFFFLPKGSLFLKNLILKIKRDFVYFQDIIFNTPKQGIMNLTGPHQFTRSYYEITEEFRPILVSHDDIEWVYSSRFGEFISPFKFMKHYSSFKKLKTIDSTKRIDLS